jgi:hypothetical protein
MWSFPGSPHHGMNINKTRDPWAQHRRSKSPRAPYTRSSAATSHRFAYRPCSSHLLAQRGRCLNGQLVVALFYYFAEPAVSEGNEHIDQARPVPAKSSDSPQPGSAGGHIDIDVRQ